MKALVTGGAGYFGELLSKKLLERGYSVRIFDINRPAYTDRAMQLIQADIRDLRAISSLCEGIDVAFHNVAQVPLARDKKLFWSVNRDGTKNLLEACAHRAVKKVIYTSSSAVYGIPKSNPVTEETVPTPIEAYGKAKLAGIRAERFGCHHRPASHNRGARSAWNLSDPFRVDLPRKKTCPCSVTARIPISSSTLTISRKPLFRQAC
jgi:nucleoside-diphosphate-sugar epimerase